MDNAENWGIITNSLTVDERFWLESFMYIRNKSGPKIDPWGTTANTDDQEKIPDHSMN